MLVILEMTQMEQGYRQTIHLVHGRKTQSPQLMLVKIATNVLILKERYHTTWEQ